jgi:hypothetical protein
MDWVIASERFRLHSVVELGSHDRWHVGRARDRPHLQEGQAMSFFGKVKQFFGAGTVKVELTVPAQVQKAAGQLSGKAVLNAVSDQHVIDVVVTLTETWSTGRGEDKEAKQFELGKVKLAEALDMKAGESRPFDFVLPFELIKSNADQLKEKGGALGMLGKAAAFANAEKSKYEVKVVADVKGAAFDPSDSKAIELV